MKHDVKKESFPTIPLPMKSFMDVDAVPTVPHLIEEVPNFQKFIEDGIAMEKKCFVGTFQGPTIQVLC